MPHHGPHHHGPHHHGPHHHGPHHHETEDGWGIPAPSPDELAPYLGSDELAHAASIALRRCPPEGRVYAWLLLALLTGEQYEEIEDASEEADVKPLDRLRDADEA